MRIGINSERRPDSRVLHALDRWLSHPAFALAIVIADATWVIYSVFGGFPGRFELIFQTVVAALTLAMVFVIQHTQARQQAVTQRKLDEILRAMPAADNAVIGLEAGSDRDLAVVTDSHRGLRDEATGAISDEAAERAV
jgi:low affinity Fe/Cu permease